METHDFMRGAWVQLNVRLPKNLDTQLKARAELEDRPVSRLVRRALVEYLKRKQRSDDQPE